MTTEIGPGTEDNSRQDVDDAAMPMLMMPVCSGVNNTFGYWMDDHFVVRRWGVSMLTEWNNVT